MKTSKELDLRILQYFRLLRFKLSWRRHNNVLTFAIPFGSSDTRPFTIFTAADSAYLRKFARPFAISALTHIVKPSIHIHLYNPQCDDFEFIEKLRRELAQAEFSWSYENFSPELREHSSGSSEQQSWKSLYICTSRFLAADEFQRRTGAALLITDIDILFNGDVVSRFGGQIDVSLLLRPEQRNICKRTLGGVVYVSARSNGRSFLARAARDNARFLSAGFYWFAFDQLALYRAYQAMRRRSRAAHFSPLTRNDISFSMQKDGLILFPKGKIKYQQEFAGLAETMMKAPKQE